MKPKFIQICEAAQTGVFYGLTSEGDIWWCYFSEGEERWRKIKLPNESNTDVAN